MNTYERTRAAIEFTGPDRLPIAGNCMEYETHGDVIHHFPRMSGTPWWTGDGGFDEWGCEWKTTRKDNIAPYRQGVPI